MISVCMATYNGGKYLKEQIGSILKQLGVTDELVISDDGSNDNTLALINSFNDRRIKIYNNECSKGVNGNFETALQKAIGDIIFLSDQDDIWMPNKIQESLDLLNDCDMIIHNAKIVDGKGFSNGSDYFSCLHKHTGFFWNLYEVRCLGCCMVFKRKVLRECLPFPKSIVGHDYWIGMYALSKFKVKFPSVQLICYRRHDDNFSTSFEKSNNSLLYKIFNKRANILWNIALRRIKYIAK